MAIVAFDPEAAIADYLRTHAVECRIIDCVPDHSPWLLAALPSVTIGALGLFMATGLSARCRDLAARMTRRRWLQDAFFAIPLTLFVALAQLPVLFWLQRIVGVTTGPRMILRDRDGNILNAPPPPLEWLGERLGDLPWWIGIAAVTLPLALAAMRRLPGVYWTIPASFCALWLFVLTYQSPYERLEPLPSGALRAEIETMARATGQPTDRLRVGRPPFFRGGMIDAHAIWWGGEPTVILSERLFNILPVPPENLSPPYRPVTAAEVRAIAAHELAHLRLRHLYILPAVWLVLIGLLAWAAAVAARHAVAMAGSRWRLAGVGDPAAFPLVTAIFCIVFCLFFPLRSMGQLAAETHADSVGLDISRDPDGFIAMTMREARARPMSWPLLEHLLFYDHPSSEQRLRRAIAWKANNMPARWQASGLSGPIRVRQAEQAIPVEIYRHRIARAAEPAPEN